MLWPTTVCVESEEGINHLLILLYPLSPEVQVSLSGFRKVILAAGWSPLGRFPLALNVAVLLHPSQGPIQRAWVYRLVAELLRSLQHLIAVGVPLPKRHQDHRLQPVLRASFDFRESRISPATAVVVLLLRRRHTRVYLYTDCLAPPLGSHRTLLAALQPAEAWVSLGPSK